MSTGNLILCRFCAKTSTFVQILDRKINASCEKIWTMISIFKNLKISDSDGLPNYICGDCVTKLKISYDFYLQCLESETKLRIEQQQIKPKLKLKKILPKDENSLFKCIKCVKIFQTKLDVENHISRIHKTEEKLIRNRSYKCFECNEHFETKDKILLHVKSHSNELLCQYCYYYFTNKTILEEHIKKMHTDLLFLCNICSKTFASKNTLFKHYQSLHKLDQISIFCFECSISFCNKTTLNTHMREKHQVIQEDTKNSTISKNGNNEADFNTQTDDLEMTEEFLDEFFLNQDENSFQFNEFDFFDDELKLKSDDFHKTDGNNIQEQNIRYKCPKCNFKCSTQVALNYHLAHDHDVFVLTCNECGAKFNRVYDMDIHMDDHFTENRLFENTNEIDCIPEFILKTNNNRLIYECKRCQRGFFRKINFYNHDCKSNNNNNNTLIKCTFCSMTFKSHMQMYVHRKTHTESQLYDCRLCDKTFKTVGGLKYHLKVHNGVKAFSCVYCEKKFTSNINLTAHIRVVHAEIKPNICTLCDKNFATIYHLKKHVLSVHQHEKKHLCSVCGKAFSQLSHLKQHNFIHSAIPRYNCDHCALGYIKKSDLKNHLNKIHKMLDVQ